MHGRAALGHGTRRRFVWPSQPLWFAVGVLALAGAAPAAIELNVTRVGFPILPGGQVVRSGTWTPIIVDVALLDQPAFDGYLRTAQLDNDGDECYDTVAVHLRAETGGTQRLYLYTLANPLRGRGRFSVELRDTEGETVEVVSQGVLARVARSAQPPSVISHDDLVILSISTGVIGRVSDLTRPDQRDAYNREIKVGHMSVLDLPELWIGLEAVDYIVWDEAAPEDLTERQLEALLEWVRQGGTLLIFASRTAGSLALSKSLDAVLPVDLGVVVVVDDLPDFRAVLVIDAGADRERGFDVPVPVVVCTRREGSTVVAAESTIASDVLTRRRVGRGQLIFAGITQKDLFQAPGSAVTFYRRVFHLAERENPDVVPDAQSLFGSVLVAVSYAQSAGLYLLIAAICSLGYFGAATFGTWRFLSGRGWRHHSWSAFAVVGLAASAASVIVVGAVHGFGEKLQQLSIIDAQAGETYGYATTFFGLKTGSDRQIDVWLPSDPVGATEPGPTNCFLRPVPAGNDPRDALTSYADPREYRLVPGSAVVEDVRIRATLKQFEGRWQGRIGGRVTGEITVRKSGKSYKDWRFTDDSYIVNELGVDLKRCYVLQTLFDIDDIWGNRNEEVYAHMIGDLPSDGREVLLAPRCYIQAADEEEVFKDMKKRAYLAANQRTWSRPFQSALGSLGYDAGSEAGLALGQEEKALLLLSTVSEFSPLHGARAAAYLMGPITWSRDRLAGLDLHEQLDNDSVILIGFAEDPGPVRLFRRRGDSPYKSCEPDSRRSRTMYRIRIPVTVVGGSPRPRADDDEEDLPDDPYDFDRGRG